MSIEQSSLQVTDHDSTGQLPDVIASLMEEVSSVVISVMEDDEHRYLLSVHYEDEEDIQDVVCTIAMLCYSMGVYHYSLHYLGREGGVVR